MRKIYYFLALICPIVVILLHTQSCKRDFIKDENYELKPDDNYTFYKDEKFVANNEANEIAINVNKNGIVLNSVNKSLLKSAKYYGKRQVHDSLTLYDKHKTPYFYVFNYKLGGYAIISADRRLLPILAYVDSGNFKKDSLPNGLIRWLETNSKIIWELRKTNTKQLAFVAQEWTSLVKPVTSLKSANDGCNPPVHTVFHTVGPLLTTTWDQGCGYNANCPLASDGPCGYALTGCVATAMAQIMAYWKYPSNYNWTQMPANYGTSETARLLRDIGNSVGMNYGGSGSGANSENINGAFKNAFRYSSASYGSYGISSYNTVESNINYGEPVLLGGCNNQSTILGIPYKWSNCHEWECDGYSDTQYYLVVP